MPDFELKPDIETKDILLKDARIILHSLNGTEPATAANYGHFYTALRKEEVIEVSVVWTTAGSDGGAVTLDMERLQGTEALDAGDTLFASTVNLKGTANTVNFPTLTATKANRVLSRGDRLALKDSGTLTALVGLQVTVKLKPVGKGNYD